MTSLSGHTALVTGSSKGVGRAIAVGLAAAGANVIVHGRNDDERLRSAVDACREHDVDAHLVTADLGGSTEETVSDLFDRSMALRDDIDILVNNAGTYIDNPYLEMEFGTFDRTMKLNVYSPFFLTQRFAQHWVKNSTKGRVLMIGSINGRLAEEVHAAYDTSKGAVEMMVKTLCVSLAPHGIRVNGLAPGLVYTPLTAPAIDDPKFRKWMELHTPNREVPGPEVCAEAAAYLVSDAAWHVHGQMLLVDGGMSAWQQPDLPADG